MIYEHRTYYVLPGKTQQFVADFARVPKGLLEQYGAKLVGMWTTAVGGQSNEVTYILAFQDLEHLDQVWRLVYADPAMVAYLGEGARVRHVASKVLRPVPYSPLQ